MGNQFLKSVNVDTADSSVHLIGGQFGTVITPYGKVTFSRSAKEERQSNHFDNLETDVQEVLRDHWSTYGMTPEELAEIPYSRGIMNIWHMNEYWDIPYIETDRTVDLF